MGENQEYRAHRVYSVYMDIQGVHKYIWVYKECRVYKVYRVYIGIQGIQGIHRYTGYTGYT